MNKVYTIKDGEGTTRILKLAVEEITICVNFGNRLGVGETLASGAAATVTCDDEATPTLEAVDVRINSAEYVDESDPDRTVAADEGVLLQLTGGTEGLLYDLVVYATDSDGDVKAGRLRVDLI